MSPDAPLGGQGLELTAESLHVAIDARFASARYDGVGRYVVSLIHALMARPDHPQLEVVWPASDEVPRWPLPAPGPGLRQLHATRAQTAESAWTQWELPRMVRRTRAQVLHVPFPLAPWFPRLPMITTLHDCNPERHPAYYGRLRQTAYTVAVRGALRASRLVIVPSEMTAEDARRFHRVPPARLRVIPMGVNLPTAVTGTADTARRSALGVPDGYVLVVGRSRPHKRYSMLIEALGRLPKGRRPALVRVGREDPRLPDGHVEAAARYGVSLCALSDVGETDLVALYRGALVVAMPSEVEGFGLPVLESLAAGAPVLAADLQPLRASGGEVARYVAGGVSAWAEAVAAALDDSAWRGSVGADGPARAALFPWSRTAAETLALYHEVAD